MKQEEINKRICKLAGIILEKRERCSLPRVPEDCDGKCYECISNEDYYIIPKITLEILVKAKEEINKRAYTLGTKRRYFIEVMLNCVLVIYGGIQGFKRQSFGIDYDKKTFEQALRKAVEYCVLNA